MVLPCTVFKTVRFKSRCEGYANGINCAIGIKWLCSRVLKLECMISYYRFSVVELIWVRDTVSHQHSIESYPRLRTQVPSDGSGQRWLARLLTVFDLSNCPYLSLSTYGVLWFNSGHSKSRLTPGGLTKSFVAVHDIQQSQKCNFHHRWPQCK